MRRRLRPRSALGPLGRQEARQHHALLGDPRKRQLGQFGVLPQCHFHLGGNVPVLLIQLVPVAHVDQGSQNQYDQNLQLR